MIRLQKILSQAGVASRRLAEDLIRQGRVEVNGHVVTKLGTKADPSRDTIKVDARKVKLGALAPERRHWLLYKPAGVVCTRADPEHRPTVIDVLTKAGVTGYFFPVGRLDFDTEGLLILTNDGEFAEKVAHPRHQLPRTYEARVRGVPDPRDLDRLARGIVLDGQRTLPATVRMISRPVKGGEPQAMLEIVIREGRNRQVRRMCDAIGHPIVALRRTKIGLLSAKGMRPGSLRELTEAEIRALMTRS